MSTNSEKLQLENEILRGGIREIAHAINNPLGALRMAFYLLQTNNPDEEKRSQYIHVINQSIEKIDENVKRLRLLREYPDQYAAGLPAEET